MKLYWVSLAAGILVGLVYGLLNVRSPAPPVVALIGLLGMLIGEQIVPIATRLAKGEPLTAAWFSSECVPKITGSAPPPAVRSASADADGPTRP
jgi:XapX domain-containing protein